MNTANPWVWVPLQTAKRIGLTGPGDIRFSNGCVYRRDDEGEWFELQVPDLPKAPL